MKKNLTSIKGREVLVSGAKAVLICVLLAVTFYKSITASVFLFPIGLLYIRYERSNGNRRHYEECRRQFKDALNSIAADLQAGYSFAKAFENSVAACVSIYGKDCEIAAHIAGAVNLLVFEHSLDRALEYLKEEADIAEVGEFCSIVRITNRHGGNMAQMIRHLAINLDGRISMQAEIMTVTASVRYEAYIMDIIPIAVIWYLNLTGPVFLAVLYTSLWGRAFMTVCMLLYLGIVCWQQSMMSRCFA